MTSTKKTQKTTTQSQPEVISEVKQDNPFHIVLNDDAQKSQTAKWYIIHTYSGHERKVATELQNRLQAFGVQDKIFELLIPTQEKIKIRKGQKHTVREKIFPGYMFIKMIVDDQSWFVVRNTPGVTSFIGIGKKPTPISAKEVEAIKKFISMEAPKYQSSFSVGEAVKIVDGPFTDFLGTVDKIDEEKGKVYVLVSIFGRETPVELDFTQIDKV